MSDRPTPRTFDEEDLAAAVAAGVVPGATAEAFLAFAASRRGEELRADEEEVRFVTSFNDVFVTIGIVALVGGLALTLGPASPVVAGAVVLVVGWGLAEIFSRRWRMAFPSIVLTVVVVAAAAVTALTGAAETLPKPFVAPLGAAAAFAVGFAHWRRFGVPISIAAATAGAGALGLALVALVAPKLVETHWTWFVLALGLAAFALAMRWDAGDLERRTRRTDIAFWLHVLAAPAIVHPIVAIAGIRLHAIETPDALVLVGLFAVIATVALVVDRRALVVSSLIYLGLSVAVLIERGGWSGSDGGPRTWGTVGAVILVLAVGWRPMRAVALGLTPAWVRARVPRPASSEVSRP